MSKFTTAFYNLSQEDKKRYFFMIYWMRKHPVEALYLIFGVRLAPHQRICLREMWNAKVVGLRLSRGMSKTFMDGAYANLTNMLYTRATQVLLTRGFRGGKLIFREAIQPMIMGTLRHQRKKYYALRCLENAASSKALDNVRIINKDPDMWSIRWQYNGAQTTGPLGKDKDKSSQLRGLRANRTLILDEANEITHDLYNSVIRPFGRVSADPLALDEDIDINTYTKIESGTVRWDWQRYSQELAFIQKKMMEGNLNYIVLEFNYEDAFYWVDNQAHESLEVVDIRKAIAEKRIKFVFGINLADLIDELQNGFTSLEDFLSENKNRIQISSGTEFPQELLESITGSEIDPKYLDHITTDEEDPYYDPDGLDPTLVPLLKCEDKCVLSVDPARQSDDAAFVIVRIGPLRKCNAPFSDVINCEVKTKIRYKDIANIIYQKLRDFPNIVCVIMDAYGGGYAVRDHLWEPEGDNIPLYDPEDEQTPAEVKERGIPLLRLDVPNNEKNTFRVSFLRGQMQTQKFLLPGFNYSSGDRRMDAQYRNIRLLRRQFSYIQSEPSGGYKRFFVDSNYKKDLFSATLLASQVIFEYVSLGKQDQYQLITNTYEYASV